MKKKLSDTAVQIASVTPKPVLLKRGLDIQEASIYSGLTKWFIRTAIWNRKIPFILAGKRYILLRDDLDAFVESQRYKVRA